MCTEYSFFFFNKNFLLENRTKIWIFFFNQELSYLELITVVYISFRSILNRFIILIHKSFIVKIKEISKGKV